MGIVTLALSAWATHARADFLPFTISDDPSVSHSSPGSLHFGLDFAIHGTAPVSAITTMDGRALSIMGGVISFDFGLPDSTTANDDASYIGGSIEVRGSIDGGPDELLFRSSSIQTTTLTHASGDQFYLYVNGIVGPMVTGITDRVGVEPWVFGSLYIGFQADSREDYALPGDHAELALSGFPLAAAVPEPGSLMMVGVAGVIGGGLWVNRRVTRKICAV